MTVIYVCKMIISLGVFSIFFENFDFLGPKGKILIFWVQTVQNDQNYVCLLHISGTIHHMIVIYGANV